MVMRMFRLRLMSYVEAGPNRAFRFEECESCGRRAKKQVADLRVRALEPFGAFTAVMIGGGIARADVAEAIRNLEPSVHLRPAYIEGVAGQWFQICSTAAVELALCSLRGLENIVPVAVAGLPCS